MGLRDVKDFFGRIGCNPRAVNTIQGGLGNDEKHCYGSLKGLVRGWLLTISAS